jgi:hypothetical protein
MKTGIISSWLLILFINLNSSQAQSNLEMKTIGGRIGFVLPEGDIDNTPGFGLNADLGTVMPNLSFHVYLDFWKSQLKVVQYDWNWNVLSLAVIGKYQFPRKGIFRPYAGGGFSLTFSNRKSSYTGPNDLSAEQGKKMETSENKLDAAVHLLAGNIIPLSKRIDGFVEAKYSLDGSDYLGIYLGANYRLR